MYKFANVRKDSSSIAWYANKQVTQLDNLRPKTLDDEPNAKHYWFC